MMIVTTPRGSGEKNPRPHGGQGGAEEDQAGGHGLLHPGSETRMSMTSWLTIPLLAGVFMAMFAEYLILALPAAFPWFYLVTVIITALCSHFPWSFFLHPSLVYLINQCQVWDEEIITFCGKDLGVSWWMVSLKRSRGQKQSGPVVSQVFSLEPP